jgi:hypothetical protein
MKKQQDLFATELPNVVAKTILEAINKLAATNCAFKIMLPNGSLHERDPNNWLNPQKEIRRSRKERPNGKMVDYYKPLVENMGIGDVVVLDWAPYGRQDLQSAVTAWCCQNWGNGSVATATNPNNTELEVLRLK